jgi:hypothetical protein
MRRIHRYTVILVILGSAFAAQSGNHGPFGRYTGPNSLGPYSIDRDISMKSLLATFGALPAGKYTYCFADKVHGLFLYTRPLNDGSKRVGMVFLSSFPNCRHLPVLKVVIDPGVWKTPEGIGIGSTKEEVLHAYHQPVFGEKLGKGSWESLEIAGIRDSERSQAFVGDSSYLYSCLLAEKQGCDDLRATRMGFSHGKLVWIAMSDEE